MDSDIGFSQSLYFLAKAEFLQISKTLGLSPGLFKKYVKNNIEYSIMANDIMTNDLPKGEVWVV